MSSQNRQIDHCDTGGGLPNHCWNRCKQTNARQCQPSKRHSEIRPGHWHGRPNWTYPRTMLLSYLERSQWLSEWFLPMLGGATFIQLSRDLINSTGRKFRSSRPQYEHIHTSSMELVSGGGQRVLATGFQNREYYKIIRVCNSLSYRIGWRGNGRNRNNAQNSWIKKIQPKCQSQSTGRVRLTYNLQDAYSWRWSEPK